MYSPQKDKKESMVDENSLKIFKNFMKKDLKFIDQSLEGAYQQHLSTLHLKYLSMFLTGQGFLSLFLLIFTALRGEVHMKLFIIYSLNLLLVIASAIKLHKGINFGYSQVSIIILQVSSIILYSELLNEDSNNLGHDLACPIALVMELLLLAPMIARCGWIFNSLSALILSIYLNVRFTGFNNIINTNGLSSFVLLANIFMILAGSYATEKLDRHLFHSQQTNEKSLKQFQHLIKSVLPSSILILQKGKVVFSNRETNRLLKLRKGALIEEKLTAIKIMEDGEKDKESEIQNFNSTSNKGLEKIVAPLEDSSAATFPSLLDIILSIKPNTRFVCGFECYSGFLKEIKQTKNRIEKVSDRYFDIKLCNFAWEGCESLIVILSENFMTQQMNSLTEQARYKDKLLATVSHDLRTPLNGVIGILELALEGLGTDINLRKR
jgi:hypothetical protein